MPDQTAPAIDRTELMARLDGDVDLLGELVQLFLEDLDERMEAIAEAVRDGDFEVLHSRTHAIKGSVANFAAAEAHEAARQLDDLAQANSSEGLAEALAQLESTMGRTRLELEELVKG